MSRPDQLYYSPAAVERFKRNERGERRRRLYQAPFTKDSYTTFHQFIQLPAAEEIMAGPMFGAWLDRIAQAVHNPNLAPEDAVRLGVARADYIGNYAVAAALASERDLEAKAQLLDGYIMIPELGRLALHGADYDLATVEVTDGSLKFIADETIYIPNEELAFATDQWQPLRHIGSDDFNIALNDIDPNRNIFRYPVAPRLTDEQYTQWMATFRDAWDFLQDCDPHLASVVRASLNTLVPAPQEPLTHGKSMAAGAAFGVIGINEIRDPLRLASHIAFGIRKHMALALRNEYPQIYPDDDRLASMPVYPPSREGYGIAPYLFDDSFINVGLARFYSNLVTFDDPGLRTYGELSFTRWYTESRQNLQALKKSGYITDTNGWVVASLEEEMFRLQQLYGTMPEAAKQTITAYTHDRLMSWRLHNITPDPQAIVYLRNRWHEGASCPPITVPGTLSRSIDAYTHIGQRTRYILSEARIKDPLAFEQLKNSAADPGRFGMPTPGDIAVACGNIRQARQYYLAAIQQQPANTEAWAGFTRTFWHEHTEAARVLERQPELVAAMYAAIGNTNLPPETLAAWLAPSTMESLGHGV